MLISTHAIVLSKLKYGDNDLIVTCYTEQSGVMSFLLRGVLKSQKSGTKVAYFQLLSQLQLIVDYKERRGLQVIKEVKLSTIYSSLHDHVFKGAIVMFLSEILAGTLKEEEQNQSLYRYLETTLLWLDTHTDYANFHLLFLLKLTKYLGFYPDTGDVDYPFFNMYEGRFELKQTGDYHVSGENLGLLKRLLGTSFDGLSELKISAKQRQSFLNMVLLYFELHLGSFKRPKSLQIFNQVFN